MASISIGGNVAGQKRDFAELAKLTSAPAMQDAEGFETDGKVKAIYYDALDFEGKPTKVFAWLGVPKGKRNMPGIVLVHGGGGTAFKEWVEKWNAKGYAAISIGVEGQTSVKPVAGSQSKYPFWKRHEHAGPFRLGTYADWRKPLEDQWMYHAVADTILANSLLGAQPGVDKSNVGIMGVSWGGVITSTVIGIDTRFAFAIPTYGCGYLAVSENSYGRALKNNPVYKEVLDPILYLKHAAMPVMWYSWPRENHFRMESLSKCYNETSGAKAMSIVPGMQHSHQSAWNREESYAFADSVVKTGKPWAAMDSASYASGTAKVTFSSTKNINGATLIYTSDVGYSGDRNWQTSKVTHKKMGHKVVVEAPIPAGTKSYFVNIESGHLICSSDYQEIK